MGTLQEDLFAVMTISRLDLLKTRRVSAKIIEKIRLQVLCSIKFARKSFCILDSVEKYRKPGQDTEANIIQHNHFPYQIIKAQTHTWNMQH